MNISPELQVAIITLIVILTAYVFVYPRTAKADVVKVALYDIGASSIALLITGFIYWNSGVAFSLYVINVNWFFFTLICYGLLELPLIFWYFKKYGIWK